MAYDTALNIISDAAVELGLGSVTDAFGSTNSNIIQLRTLLKSTGRDLVNARDWTHLGREYTFNTVNGTQTYALPADFCGMVPQSQWNRTTRFPLGGPAGADAWQYIQATGFTSGFTVIFRQWQGTMYLSPTPTGVATIAFEYQSNYWVSPTGGTVPTTDTPTANTDIIYFEPNLAMRALKLAFLRAKGFDTTAAQQDYETTLAGVASGDGAQEVVTIGGKGRSILLGDRNVPWTNYG